MAPRIQTVIPYGALRRSLFVNDNNKDDYGRHRGQVLYGMTLSGSGTVISIAPGAVYTAQGLRIYLDATDGQVDLAAVITPSPFLYSYQEVNLPFCVMVYLKYAFTADQVAQSVNITTYGDSAGLFTVSARVVPFDMNTGAPVYNLAPLDPIYLDVAQPGGYTALINYNGPAVSYPSSLTPSATSIQFGEIPLGYVLFGVNPANASAPVSLSSAGVSIVSYDNAFNMISDLIGQDVLLPLQPNDVSYTLVDTPSGTAQYQGYSAKNLLNSLTAATLVRPSYGTPNAVDGSHLDSNWATYRQPSFLKDGINVFEALRRMDVVLRQWLDFTGNQSLISITQDAGATFASGNLPLQASVDAILAVFDGGLTAATNANLVVWPTVTTGLDTGTPTNRTVKGGLIPHVENTLLGKLTTNEGDSTLSAIAALDTAIFVTLTAALGVTASRAQLRDPTTSALTVNLTSPTLVSPAMSGTPTAPTQAFTPPTAPASTLQVANSTFVNNAIAYYLEYAPVLGTTGHVATAVTNSTPTDSSTQVATNAFVQQALANSPALGMVPTAPTASPGTSTTQIATTAFVAAALSAGTAVVQTFFKSDTTFHDTASNSLVNSGYSAALANPLQSTSSKVRIRVTMPAVINAGAGGNIAFVSLSRGSTDLTPGGCSGIVATSIFSDGELDPVIVALEWVDAPASTTPATYNVTWGCSGNATVLAGSGAAATLGLPTDTLGPVVITLEELVN